MRSDFRKTFVGYAFDYKTAEPEAEMTFDGFAKQSMSMLDELDAFTLG